MILATDLGYIAGIAWAVAVVIVATVITTGIVVSQPQFEWPSVARERIKQTAETERHRLVDRIVNGDTPR